MVCMSYTHYVYGIYGIPGVHIMAMLRSLEHPEALDNFTACQGLAARGMFLSFLGPDSGSTLASKNITM